MVFLEKARGVHGPAATPYEAWLHAAPDGRQEWTISSGEDTRDQAIRELLAAGITSQRQIAKHSGIALATVNRRIKKTTMGDPVVRPQKGHGSRTLKADNDDAIAS